jgi:hypothetical protein
VTPLAERAVLNAVMMVAVAGLAAPADAHRLDEYLQAARVEIAADAVSIDLDLTPGANIAQQIAGWIDTDRDGRVSADETAAYGRQVLESLDVALDGTAVALQLTEFRAPDPAEMSLGVGPFSLRAAATIQGTAAGRHQLTFVNRHHPEWSLYAANALVPGDRRVQILAQHRPRDQRALTIDYDVAGGTTGLRIAWLIGGLTSVAALAYGRRHRSMRGGRHDA